MSMLSVKQTFLAIKSHDFGNIDFFKPQYHHTKFSM